MPGGQSQQKHRSWISRNRTYNLSVNSRMLCQLGYYPLAGSPAVGCIYRVSVSHYEVLPAFAVRITPLPPTLRVHIASRLSRGICKTGHPFSRLGKRTVLSVCTVNYILSSGSASLLSAPLGAQNHRAKRYRPG